MGMMTRIRLIDHLLSEPFTPLALAARSDEGWEPLAPRRSRIVRRLLAKLRAPFDDLQA